MRHVIEHEQLVPRPRSEVFAFFAAAENLARLTPTSLGFRIVTALPITMRSGTVIDYHIKVFGLRARWRTVIEDFDPESKFVDIQSKGPYRYWRHLHQFEDVPGGTLVRDRVEYEMPLGLAGELARVLFVGRQLRQIFAFRRQAISRIFAKAAAVSNRSRDGAFIEGNGNDGPGR